MPNRDNNPQNGVGGTSPLYNYGTSPNTRSAISQKVRLLSPHVGNAESLHHMGVVSSVSRSENKNVEAVRGIGFGDKIAELVPGVTDPTQLSLERTLLYLCNLWQATGYASGTDGPVRSLAHHRWPFDLEMQMVFSLPADADFNGAGLGYNNGNGGSPGNFDGGIRVIQHPEVTNDRSGRPGSLRSSTALITMFEGCWFTSYSTNYSKDQGIIMESGDCQATDVHDFASAYGEFLATGNDPTIGQLGSLRYADQGYISAGNAGVGSNFLNI